MMLIYNLLVILNTSLFCFGRSKFLSVPLNNVQLTEISDGPEAKTVIRMPRHENRILTRTFNSPQIQFQTAESSLFDQDNYNPHQYVDYGAHTGHHGSFGWYADFPVQGK